MEKPQSVTLFIGNDPDSKRAVKVVEATGIILHVVDCTLGRCDFEPPLLISAWGVFDSLDSIIRFGQIASETTILDESISGVPFAG
jgi:hypothetical protein